MAARSIWAWGTIDVGELRVAVLGPIQVERAGRPVRLGPRLTELLSVLVLELGAAVPATRLVELLWGDPAPPSAAATLRSHVSHLRRALGPASLVTVGSGAGVGYRLTAPPESTDAHRFERACADGRRLLATGRPKDAGCAVTVIGEALASWRGPAYAEVADRSFALSEVARLTAVRRAALRDYGEALSACGRHADAAAHLAGCVAEEPHDEGLRRLLVLALYAADRVDEAAEVCRQGIELLRERGIDSPGLQDLQRLVLRREVPASAPPSPVPRLLPPDPQRFVGRADEMAVARRRLGDAAERGGVLVVTGPAGVGKTSFAVRLAHTVAERFPDGQLFLNLRGFDPSGTPMDPAEALRVVLDTLGMPPHRIPASVPAQAALYRDQLAGRRMLVVLDNARDTDQIRMLLAGVPGCATLVTSRNRLAALVAYDDAHPLTLDLLSRTEAEDLLARRIGADRVAAEPGAVDTIVERCARLPLALSIVAARAAAHPAFTLQALADELLDSGGGLYALAGGEAVTTVRTVFSWSYRTLSSAAARLFRLLGLPVGPDIGVLAAAALAGCPPAEVRPLLVELTSAHLLAEQVPGRYSAHDLLRAYAVELSRDDASDDRQAALRGLLDYYLHTAYAAERLLWPHRDPITVEPAATKVTIDDLTDQSDALAWFTACRAALLPAVEHALDAGFVTHAWQLAWTLTSFLHRQGLWPALAASQTAALAAVQHLGDRAAQAQAHRELALALTQLSRHDEAHAHLRRAHDLFDELGDRVGQAHTYLNLGWICEVQGRQRAALDHDRRALELFTAAGHKIGQARALNAVGWDLAQLGQHLDAVNHCQEALRLHQSLDNLSGEARAWDSLGYAHHHLGQFAEALACYDRALALHRQDADRYCEAETLTHLGDTQHADDADDAARGSWLLALAILEDLGHPDAEQVRQRLAAVADGPG
ncbi:AfsR/SARP family transcriptional regulator [Micromonospora pattaloongensis]|nr:BTAD domain-containing putative transcriptional regulator [Micromonospora pattaloongensis]